MKLLGLISVKYQSINNVLLNSNHLNPIAVLKKERMKFRSFLSNITILLSPSNKDTIKLLLKKVKIFKKQKHSLNCVKSNTLYLIT